MAVKLQFVESHGQKVAIIVLDRVKALNAINTSMYKDMFQFLEQVKTDKKVVSVLFHSETQKAFCAGGDVEGLVESYENKQESLRLAKDFFTTEYSFDLYLRHYPKPTITWGQGFVMGGGLGVFMSTDIRVVTASSQLSMPEINIGLFPDVGASYFLNQIPKHVARFMALTSARLSGAEALSLHMATHLMSEAGKSQFIEALLNIDYTKNKLQDVKSLSNHLLSLCEPEATQQQNAFALLNELSAYEETLNKAGSILELDSVLHNISGEHPQSRLAKDIQNYDYGSNLSKALIFDLLKRGEGLSVVEAFCMEWVLAINCYRKGDFYEGVRALLIDKDRSPQWKHGSLKDVGAVDEFFALKPGEKNDLRLALSKFKIER